MMRQPTPGDSPRRRPATALLIPALSVLAAALLGGCGAGGSAQTEGGQTEIPRNVRVMAIAPGDLEQYLELTGPLLPLRGTDLGAEESGRVLRIPRDKGARVDAGGIIVELDRSLLAAEKEAAAASRDLAAFNLDRAERLFAANSISEIEVRDARAQHRQLAAAAEIAELRHERAAVKAPFAGIVTQRYVEIGQLVGPGTPVARVVDPYALKLAGAVTERELTYLRAGMPARIAVGDGAAAAQGSVRWVGFEADPLTGKFPVEIQVDNRDLALSAGVVARARVLKRSYENAVVIPRDAVVDKPYGAVAFVVEDGRARERRLSLGPDQGLMVLIEDGLRAGETLIVRGQREVSDGSAVAVQERAERPDGSLAEDPPVIAREEAVSHAWREDAAGDAR